VKPTPEPVGRGSGNSAAAPDKAKPKQSNSK
jgi:hypothetical protein